MNCPKCNHEISPGATFCGNCGQAVVAQVQPQPQPQVGGATQGVPVSPVLASNQAPSTVQPVVETTPDGGGKAIASLVLGILGLVGSIIPILGLIMGIVGIVLSSKSLHSSKKGMAVAGLVLGILVIVLSIIFFIVNLAAGLAYQDELGMGSSLFGVNGKMFSTFLDFINR